MRPIGTPDGTGIHIDSGLCRRCGACTGVCPTGALERSFLPEDELYGLIDEALAGIPEGAVLVLAGSELCDTLDALPLSDRIAIATFPSLLVLDENHLVYAARRGATGIAVVGSLFSHHGVPALLQDALALTETLVGVPTIYVEGGDSGRLAQALASFETALPKTNPPTIPAGPLQGTRREQLAALLSAPAIPAASLTAAAFGQVRVQEAGCTLCGGCARGCPTGALGFDPADGALRFRPLSCVACGLCASSCPERVLSFEAGLHADVDLLAEQVLVEDEVVPCVDCGVPHLPVRLQRRVRDLLAERQDLPQEATQVDRCARCRTIGVLPAPRDVEASVGDLSARAVLGLAEPPPSGCACGRSGGCRSGAQPASLDPGLRATEASREAHYPRSPLPAEIERRSFLKGLGTMLSGFIALISGEARARSETASAVGSQAKRRMAMAIDLDKCIGCHACTVACKAENNIPLGAFRDWVEEHLIGTYPHAMPYFLPKLCNQCDDPGCLRACPTGAIFRRGDGIVDLNPEICIGCRACNVACPYGMTFMNTDRGTADKCNFCSHRVDQGLDPACVDVCPSQCRIFGDLEDPESPVSVYLRERRTQVLRRDLGLGPNIHYVSLPAELNR